MEIRIYETSMTGNYRILINPEKNIFRCNKLALEMNPAVYAFCIKEISKTWPKKLEDYSICDATKINITINEMNKIKTYSFYGKYPENFNKYNILTKEIKDGYNKKSSVGKNL